MYQLGTFNGWVPKGEGLPGYTRAVTLFKAASTVSLLTFVSRITGLARELLIASTFGASALTDAFNVAFRIPNLFRRLFAEGAFSQAFVPKLIQSFLDNQQIYFNRLFTSYTI